MRLENTIIERENLRSHFVREFIGDREFQDVSTLQVATGVDLGNLTRWKWVNWVIGKALGFFSWSVTGIFNYFLQQTIKAVNFDMTQSYEEINSEIESNNLAIITQAGNLLGSGVVWIASIAVAGQAAIKFPVIAARVGLALAEEGGQTLRNQLSSFLENTTENVIDNILMTAWAGWRKIGEVINLFAGNAPINWESQDTLTVGKTGENILNKIPGGKWVRNLVAGFFDGLLDAALDVAYTVTFTIDDHFISTQAAVDARQENYEPTRTLEVFPDATNEEESIILEDTQNNVELALNNYLGTHQLIGNRDIGTVVGQTYDEWYTLKPQSRKLVLEFRGKETPPFLNPDGSIAQRVQIAIPNAKASISWTDLKQIKRFTWGNYLARGVFEDRRQMSVWGATEAEAKDTLLALANLSTGDLVQVSVSHPEIQNIKRRKSPTLVYPTFATMLVRKTTVGVNDYTLIDGQNKAMARQRLEIWKEDPPNWFSGF